MLLGIAIVASSVACIKVPTVAGASGQSIASDSSPGALPPPACRRATQASIDAWSETRSDDFKLFAGELRVEIGPSPRQRLSRRLAHTTQRWSDAWQRTCSEPATLGSGAAALALRRVNCLEDVQVMIARAVELLTGDPGADIRHAHEGLDLIDGQLAICGNERLVAHHLDAQTAMDPIAARRIARANAASSVHRRMRPFEPLEPIVVESKYASAPVHEARITQLFLLAEAERALEHAQYEVARRKAQQAAKLAQNAGDEFGLAIARQLEGGVEYQLARYGRAAELWTAAQLVLIEQLGPSHPTTATTYNQMGLLHDYCSGKCGRT